MKPDERSDSEPSSRRVWGQKPGQLFGGVIFENTVTERSTHTFSHAERAGMVKPVRKRYEEMHLRVGREKSQYLFPSACVKGGRRHMSEGRVE